MTQEDFFPQTILKMTLTACGANQSTLERKNGLSRSMFSAKIVPPVNIAATPVKIAVCERKRFPFNTLDPTVGPCLERNGGPRWGAVSYERGTPVHVGSYTNMIVGFYMYMIGHDRAPGEHRRDPREDRSLHYQTAYLLIVYTSE